MDGQKTIAIVGPTASGKTSLGIFIAQKLKGEIISADSRQVYRGLNIGTGKVTKKEMVGIPHHLLDVANPKQQFSVSDFERLAQKAYSNILQNTRIPIVVGGTGLYIDVLLGRMSIPNIPPNPKLRAKLEKKTTEALFNLLQEKDPVRAATIDQHNKRRLIRALEIAFARSTENFKGDSRSATARGRARRQQAATRTPEKLLGAQCEVLWLGLNPGEQQLRKNIRARLLSRIHAGMVREAKALHARGLSYKRMYELGLEYRSLARLLQKKISKEVFVDELERAINQYAKRQMRWFKRNKEIHWIETSPAGRAGKTEALRLARQFLITVHAYQPSRTSRAKHLQ